MAATAATVSTSKTDVSSHLTVTVSNPLDADAEVITVDLPAEIFDVQTNLALIHQVVTAQLAAARQGTHSVKRRGEVRGGGRKPYRQKGTGRARQGSIRAPQFTGGGVVHGPHPRDYSQRTPKKMKAAALRGALSDRAREERITIVTALVQGETPSTRDAVTSLRSVVEHGKVLLVLDRTEAHTWKSLRNAAAAHLIYADQLNTYDVLVSDEVVFTAAALDTFVAGPPKGRSVTAAASSDELTVLTETETDIEETA